MKNTHPSFTSFSFEIQSTLQTKNNAVPSHVAVIMDGNGRWAEARGLPRSAGHEEGASAVRGVVEVAARAGISNLTLYAFSSDNWKRSRSEINCLMRLFARFMKQEEMKLLRQDIRFSVIGRRDRLSRFLVGRIEDVERRTRNCRTMHLRIAIDYSARHEAAGEPAHQTGIPDVDLLIRTGGERRLSDFLLLESAYAELFFLDEYWPDFSASHWQSVLGEFQHRHRRFGQVA